VLPLNLPNWSSRRSSRSVSLGRLPAWVAMVIIAREFAVTLTRMATTQQGVVIPAAGWGKLKTIVQVAAIFFLIAFDPTPLWVDVLVYVAVAVTPISAVDYFFGLRRMLREADERRRGTAESPS
jgi:CDP-diacylglycerol---glycerol-3-phosphate 3-phosphatidyltransferase